ncbi:type VI secretion system Vgr family protein [Achromobacter spanius]|uniref:type VI secretion system Vgr family protein n=1 Tax=Achromobacter spanius TaxID=217203 RepID=UPI00320A7E2D
MPRISDVRFTFSASAAGVDFEVVEFTLDETLSEPFQLRVELSSFDPAVDFGVMLDQPALFTIWRADVAVRHVHGILTSFEQGDTGFRRTRYRAVVEPALARAGLCSDWRIFQQQSVPEILAQIIKSHGITDYEQVTTNEHLPREYCVQAGDTDLQFLARLAAEEGFFYRYAHTENGHRLILGDRIYVHGEIEGGPVTYNPAPGGDQPEPALRRFTYTERVRTARTVQRDYTYTHPQYDQEHTSVATDLDHQDGKYEHYSYPGRYKRDEAGKPYTQSRLLGLRRDARMARVEGDDARLVPGLAFDLTGHPREDWNQGWRPVRMRHHGVQHTSQQEEGAEASQGTQYRYTADIVPDKVDWKSEPAAKPRIDGPQIATVVGPANEEIYCDAHGRVKVQFPWDRLGKHDEHSSCWIRVSQNWAGAVWGHMAIPRIGQEVIVHYLDGDCDQPVIVGRTYRATNLPPYELPKHKTRMTIKSKSHKGDGFNELRFEDENDHEEIYIHAQKDQNIVVEHNETLTVGNDQAIAIGHDRQTNIGQDELHTTGRDRKEHIRQDVFTTIDRNEVRRIGNTLREDIASSHLLKIGEHQTVVIEGAQSIEARTTLRTLTREHIVQGTDRILVRGPNGKITLDASGITLDAPNIVLRGNVKIISPSSDQVQAVEAAIRKGSPLIEECPFAGSEGK